MPEDVITNINANGIDQVAEEARLMGMDDEELLTLFVNQLVEAKTGVKDMSIELKEQIKGQLKERLEYELQKDLLMALPEEKLAEIEQMSENGVADTDEFGQVLEEAGIDIDAIMQKTLTRFKDEYLAQSNERVEA